MNVLWLHANSAFTTCRDIVYLIACIVALRACARYKYLWGKWKIFLLVNLLAYAFVCATRRALPLYDIFTVHSFSVLVVPAMFLWSKLKGFCFSKAEYLIMFLLPMAVSSMLLLINWHIALYYFEP